MMIIKTPTLLISKDEALKKYLFERKDIRGQISESVKKKHIIAVCIFRAGPMITIIILFSYTMEVRE